MRPEKLSQKKAWTTPKLIVHGTVVKITLSCTDKTDGGSDGLTYHGLPIQWGCS